MEIKLLILKKMITIETDLLDDLHYMAHSYAFYDFYELSKLDKADYESLLKEMRHEGLIEIDMNGANSFNRARIMATRAGAKYMRDNS